MTAIIKSTGDVIYRDSSVVIYEIASGGTDGDDATEVNITSQFGMLDIDPSAGGGIKLIGGKPGDSLDIRSPGGVSYYNEDGTFITTGVYRRWIFLPSIGWFATA